MPGFGSPATSIRPSLWLLLLPLLAIVTVLMQRSLPLGILDRRSSRHGLPNTASPHPWVLLEDCRFVSRSTNDGDSFRVAADGKEYTFRLYFVDCPETQRLPSSPGRINDQGRYFAGLTDSEVLAFGKDARTFTANLLGRSPFTIFTRWERVFDSQRFYAHVRFPAAQGQPADLAEALVSAGFARIHTSGADHPLGLSERQQHQHLRSLERKARASRLGAWHHLSSR